MNMNFFVTQGMSVRRALAYLVHKGVLSPRLVFVDNINSQYLVVA